MRVLLSCLLILPLSLGCDSSTQPTMPQPYPVTGTVVTASGKKVTEGELTFSSEANPALTITGTLSDDGTFQVKTINASRVEDGVPAGEYRVTYIKPIKGGADVQVIHLKKPVTIEAKENTLKLVLP